MSSDRGPRGRSVPDSPIDPSSILPRERRERPPTEHPRGPYSERVSPVVFTAPEGHSTRWAIRAFLSAANETRLPLSSSFSPLVLHICVYMYTRTTVFRPALVSRCALAKQLTKHARIYTHTHFSIGLQRAGLRKLDLLLANRRAFLPHRALRNFSPRARYWDKLRLFPKAVPPLYPAALLSAWKLDRHW